MESWYDHVRRADEESLGDGDGDGEGDWEVEVGVEVEVVAEGEDETGGLIDEVEREWARSCQGEGRRGISRGVVEIATGDMTFSSPSSSTDVV